MKIHNIMVAACFGASLQGMGLLNEAVLVVGQFDTLAKEVQVAKPFAQQLYAFFAKKYQDHVSKKDADIFKYAWRYTDEQGMQAVKELCQSVLDHQAEYTDGKDVLHNNEIAFMQAVVHNIPLYDAIQANKPGWSSDVPVEGREAECFFNWLRRIYYLNRVAAGHTEITKDIVPVFEYICRVDHDTLQQKWGQVSGYYCCYSDSPETWTQLSAGTIMITQDIGAAAEAGEVVHEFTTGDASLLDGKYLGPTVDELEKIIVLAGRSEKRVITTQIAREHMTLLVHVCWEPPSLKI